MKLLTHNMLTSHVKGVKNGYPLRILVILVHAAQQTVQCNCVCAAVLYSVSMCLFAG